MNRRSELRRTGPPRARSRRRAAEHPAYLVFVEQQIAANPHCQLEALIRVVDPTWRGCRGWATGLHHLRKRSSGGALISEANTLTGCNPCNAGWIEDHPRLARKAGLVVRSGDPLWDELGARAARLEDLPLVPEVVPDALPGPVAVDVGPDPF